MFLLVNMNIILLRKNNANSIKWKNRDMYISIHTLR